MKKINIIIALFLIVVSLSHNAGASGTAEALNAEQIKKKKEERALKRAENKRNALLASVQQGAETTHIEQPIEPQQEPVKKKVLNSKAKGSKSKFRRSNHTPTTNNTPHRVDIRKWALLKQTGHPKEKLNSKTRVEQPLQKQKRQLIPFTFTNTPGMGKPRHTSGIRKVRYTSKKYKTPKASGSQFSSDNDLSLFNGNNSSPSSDSGSLSSSDSSSASSGDSDSASSGGSDSSLSNDSSSLASGNSTSSSSSDSTSSPSSDISSSSSSDSSSSTNQLQIEVEKNKSVDELIAYATKNNIILGKTSSDLVVRFMAAVLNLAQQGDVEKAIEKENILALVALTAKPDLWKEATKNGLIKDKITLTTTQKTTLDSYFAAKELEGKPFDLSRFTIIEDTPQSSPDHSKKASNWTTKDHVIAATATIIAASLIVKALRRATRSKNKISENTHSFKDLLNLKVN